MKNQKIVIEGEIIIRSVIIPETELFFYNNVTRDLLSVITRDNGETISLGLSKVYDSSSQISTDIVIEKNKDFAVFNKEYFNDNPLRKEYLDLCRSDENYLLISKENFETRRLEKLSNI